MGSRAARPGWCAGGQGRAPPQPQPRSLPLEGSPGKLIPRDFLLPMAGDSQQRDARDTPPLLCRLGLCCCGFALPSPRVSSCLEKGQDATMGAGMGGWDAPRQTRAAEAARGGRAGLYWGWGAQCCGMYPVSHRHIFIYIRRTLGVPVCVYTGCVCVYIFICCIYKDIHIHRFVLIT